jgi:HK97 family phage major capsid protein
MTVNIRELRARRGDVIDKAQALSNAAELADRDLTAEEQVQFDSLMAEADALEARSARLENLDGVVGMLNSRKAPSVAKIGRGDNPDMALAHFIRSGDASHMGELRTEDGQGRTGVSLRIPTKAEMRAVTDSTMNITTDADGKYAVPTGFVQEIANRRSEMMLADKLGVRRIPGKGTTVNYPIDGQDPQSFAVTSEQSDAHDVAWSRNAGVLGIKAYTLLMYTRAVELTAQIMRDNDANLMAHIADKIGREYAQTHNALLITEAAANGTALKTYASATAVAAGDPEAILFNDTLSYYLDEGNSNAWVTRPSNFGKIASLTGNPRLYAETPGGAFQRELLGYPVYYSNQVTASAASAKDLYFGNWYFMGMREDPEINLLVNPYRAPGLTILEYSFGAVYGVIQAGAIGYGVHPSA